MSSVTLVVARADNGVIGGANRIPWRIPEDQRRFKTLTLGKAVVMGRKTWESLPKRPLPGRLNIIVTRDASYLAAGAHVCHSLDDAILHAEHEGHDEIVIAGGAEIYATSLPRASRIELTEVHRDFPGEVRIAAFDPSIWLETERVERSMDDGLRYSYVRLEKADRLR